MMGSLYAGRTSPAQLQLADEVAESQQGYSPPTQLPKVPHEDRSHHSQEVHAGIQHGDFFCDGAEDG